MNASERASKYVAALKKENERLRVTIVNGILDCEAASNHEIDVGTKGVLQQVAARLRAALVAKP